MINKIKEWQEFAAKYFLIQVNDLNMQHKTILFLGSP